jgi:hypothetical protein
MLPICIICGTNKIDPITSFCINNHDDWLEETDDIKNFERASKNLEKTIEELYNMIIN